MPLQVVQIYDIAQHLVESHQGLEVLHPTTTKGQNSLPYSGLLCNTFHSMIYVNTKIAPRDGIAWTHVPIETASAVTLQRFVV